MPASFRWSSNLFIRGKLIVAVDDQNEIKNNNTLFVMATLAKSGSAVLKMSINSIAAYRNMKIKEWDLILMRVPCLSNSKAKQATMVNCANRYSIKKS